MKEIKRKNSGIFPAEHKEFISIELKQYFDSKRMFIVCPLENEINSRAKAIIDD
jgi:hypothetical protein